MVKGTVEAADGEATEALGLGGEGAESGVDVGVRKRKHVGIGGGWWWLRIVFCGIELQIIVFCRGVLF